MSIATAEVHDPKPLLVLGVLSNERRQQWRERLRKLYAPFADRVIVRYVFDQTWLTRHPKLATEDSVGVAVGRGRDLHCAHKMVGWWSTAHKWPGTFYAKTDDDAVLDLGRLLPILESLPRRRLYSGILRYSSINESSLEGICWSAGGHGALRKRSRYCKSARGPIVFAEGPLIVMSSDVQAMVAPRLKLDDRQRCHFEDLLLGKEIALLSQLNLVNLGPLIAEPNVVSGPRRGRPRGEWLGVKGPLGHWARTEALYSRTIREFERAAREVPPRPEPVFNCSLWAHSFPRLREFPCCQDWSLCEPPDGGAAWSQLRAVYKGNLTLPEIL